MIVSNAVFVETHDEVDSEDIENRLLQVMEDEFEVSIEDDSAYGVRCRDVVNLWVIKSNFTCFQVAEQIVKIFTQCKESDFSLVDSLYQKYTARQNSRSTSAPVQIVEQPEVSDDDDY